MRAASAATTGTANLRATFADGVLTINLAGGGTLTANVTDDTEIACPPAASAADDDRGEHHHHGGCHHDEDRSCGTDALTTGRMVREPS
jgi:hypothetical protein